MIYITGFDTDFNGKKFKDTGTGTEYVCVGYGDNQGNAYLVGMRQSTSGAVLRTVLLKNVEFIP